MERKRKPTNHWVAQCSATWSMQPNRRIGSKPRSKGLPTQLQLRMHKRLRNQRGDYLN